LAGLALASLYGGCLWTVLRGLHAPVGPDSGRFCGTPGVMALTLGALLCAPIAVGLGVAIVRARGGMPAGDPWRILSAVAIGALFVAAAANWCAFVPYLLP
jgi:hypothetical protein